MAGHRIDARVEKNGSTFWPDRKQAEQMVAGVLGLTIRWRNRYTDTSGKDWDVVDGEASWGLFQNPESKRFETLVGLEIYRRVHNNGSTSGFTTDEGERMVKGTVGVGVLTRNGVVGWKPAPLDLPAVPDQPSPNPKKETPLPGTESPAKPQTTPPTPGQKEAESAPTDASPTTTKTGSKLGWILAVVAVVVGCVVAGALIFLLRRKNTGNDSSSGSSDSDTESDSSVQEDTRKSVICPSCNASLKVPNGLTKRKVRCPKCSAQLTLR